MPATIKDIARECGVSTAVVSVVLRNKEGRIQCSERNRRLILNTARKLDYKPNLMARSLVRRKTQTIALITKSLQGIPYFYETYQGIKDEASASDYNVITCHTDDKNLLKELDFFEGQVDGVISTISIVARGGEILRRFLNMKQPLVSCFERDKLPGRDLVIPDMKKACKMALEYLQSKMDGGTIGLINSYMIGSGAQMLRKLHSDFLITNELPFREKLMQETEQSVRGGFLAMNELMKNNPDVKAVFCESDLKAIGAIKAVRDSGKRVPDDIAVMGLDNWEAVLQFSDVALTSVDPGKYNTGRQAFKLLYQRMENPEKNIAPKTVVVEPELVIRDSA